MNGHSHPSRKGTVAAAAAILVALAACDSPSGIRVPGNDGEEPTLQAVLVTPDGQTVQAGATRQFQAAAILSDGDTTDVDVTWSATGGTITTGGLYTAGSTAGAFRVVATAQNGFADTVGVTVTVPSTSPTLIGVLVTPPSTTVAAGGAVQFAAVGQLSNGATQAVNVTWTATGGTISGGGLYTAGAGAGSFRVVATGPGGLADTSAVTVTAAGSPAAYTRVVGDDWKSYATKDQLRGADLFWWFRSGDVYQYVDLVPDATFGQVARITFQQSDETGYAPKIDEDLPQPLEKMWFRWRMRYAPGWTTAGPLPANYANSYKVAFWLWDGYNGRGQVELTNTTQYMPGWGVQDPNTGSFLSYAETALPGSQSFGQVTTEWTDNQWYEFVVYYEKTGPTSARQHWWKRRLTNNGVVADNAWTYTGISVSGAATPRVRGITLGANRNKSNPSTMYIYWGPWEVVDGSRYPDPWGMPNLQ
jgi:hypothetical protein